MAAKFFTGLPLDGPDPECVLGHGEAALAARGEAEPPRSPIDHSRPRPSAAPTTGTLLPMIERPPARACDDSPLAGSHRTD
jgi:hypothetical protein